MPLCDVTQRADFPYSHIPCLDLQWRMISSVIKELGRSYVMYEALNALTQKCYALPINQMDRQPWPPYSISLRWVDGCHQYKYVDTHILIQEWVDVQIFWYKYSDSNILIQIFGFKYLVPEMGGWLGSTSSGPIWFPHHAISRLIRESRLYSLYSIYSIYSIFYSHSI